MLALFCSVSASSLNTSTEHEQQGMAARHWFSREVEPMLTPEHLDLQHSPGSVSLQLLLKDGEPAGDAGDE